MAGVGGPSMRLYRLLDSTKYSHELIVMRRNVYRVISELRTTMVCNVKMVLTGSRREGMSAGQESDLDVLYFLVRNFCIDDPTLVDRIPAHVNVFNIRNTQPGYCMLEFLRPGTESEIDICSLGKMLSSKALIDSLNCAPTPEWFGNVFREYRTRTGPALTTTIFPDCGPIMDHVMTFSCLCRAILEDWIKRHRTNDWPPSTLRQSVLHMTGNLVGTGPDDSETKHLEWRYCFNEIEMLILETLNDTQLKLYKLLKIINTDILSQRGLPLTSFMMKNVVFWLAEKHPQSQFLPETLYHWFREALLLLKHWVEVNNLPYYMIPGRNLLKEKVKVSDRHKLLRSITDILEMGPVNLLFRCETLKEYATLRSSELSELKQKLDFVELCRIFVQYYVELLYHQEKDPKQEVLYTLWWYRVFQIISSRWPSAVSEAQRIQVFLATMRKARRIFCRQKYDTQH